MLSNIFNWSVVAIMASFTLMPASTGRTTAPTVEPIVEEAELKGCAVTSQGLTNFKYIGASYSDTEVKKLDNWEFVSSGGHLCNSEADERACTISVSEEFVEPGDEDNPPTLKTGLTLSTSPYAPNIYYVTGSNASSFDFYNEMIP